MEKTQSLLQTVQRFFKIALRLNDRHLFIRKLLKFKRVFLRSVFDINFLGNDNLIWKLKLHIFNSFNRR